MDRPQIVTYLAPAQITAMMLYITEASLRMKFGRIEEFLQLHKEKSDTHSLAMHEYRDEEHGHTVVMLALIQKGDMSFLTPPEWKDHYPFDEFTI